MLPNPVTWASHGNTTVGWAQCHGIFVCQSDSHHVDSHPQGPYCGWTHTHSILSLSISPHLDSCTGTERDPYLSSPVVTQCSATWRWHLPTRIIHLVGHHWLELQEIIERIVNSGWWTAVCFRLKKKKEVLIKPYPAKELPSLDPSSLAHRLYSSYRDGWRRDFHTPLRVGPEVGIITA